MSSKWSTYDVTKLFSFASLHEVTECEEWVPMARLSTASSFPDFGAHLLQKAALSNVCADLRKHIHLALSGVCHVPSVFVAKRMSSVWDRVIETCLSDSYSTGNVDRVLRALQKEGETVVESTTSSSRGSVSSQGTQRGPRSEEKLTGNSFLMEVGIKTGLSLMFTLLKQAWAQHAWQLQLQQALSQSSSISLAPAPDVNLPVQVLKSVLDILNTIPPLSLNNPKALSQVAETCLNQSLEFLQWVMSPTSNVDTQGKSLALQVMLSLYLQRGSLMYLLEWVEGIINMLVSYQDMGGGVTTPPLLEVGYCQRVVCEIRTRTELKPKAPSVDSSVAIDFSSDMLADEGHVHLMGFLQFLMKELSVISESCISYFGENETGNSDYFLSQSSEAYAFGSNSSSQLAMRSSDKFHAATLMPHMEDVQVVSAGHYCSFLIYSNGCVKTCGKGSYGRLGLGHNEMQSTLQLMTTFPPEVEVRMIASSKGSDGHSLALTAEGRVYSWGDGSCGKLGHGDTSVQKTPKMIARLDDKVVRYIACGNKHSAAVTDAGELYTWGEGDHGRLGLGNTLRSKEPAKVEAIGAVKQVACGEAHTLALSVDGKTVWSFGNGDLGRLGHGDTGRQILPKAIEALQGMNCEKVCAANQFSLVLVGGKVYSFGKGSGVGQGSTDSRQMSPWLIEGLGKEMVIDITTGDGHCLALTKRGEVFAWGTNSMGQCGQGHSNGSILLPAKVQGLEGVQVQQISAGTSHSVVWTALPCNRSASALWHWPYCVSVGEKTLEKLLNLLDKFSDFDAEKPVTPFQSIDSQQSFVLSLLTLLRTHLSVLSSVGPDNIHTTCGALVKPLRHLLFKLVDSHLTPALDKETSLALVVGSAILLPPVQDRLDLLLSILPEDPTSFVNLTTGQLRQLDIILDGFSSRTDFVGLFASEVEAISQGSYDGIDLSHVNKLFDLCHRMVQYLQTATLCSLRGQPLPQRIRLGCPLLNSFQEFLTSAYINVLSVVACVLKGVEPTEGQCLPNKGKQLLIHHMAPFDHLLRDTSLAVLEAIREAAAASDKPALFLGSKQEVLFGFLAYQYPYYFALSMSAGLELYFNTVDVLMELARTVHQLVSLLSPSTVAQLEKEELLWDKTDDEFDMLSMSRQYWNQLVDYERHICYYVARLLHGTYNITSSGIYKGLMVGRGFFGCHGEFRVLKSPVENGKFAHRIIKVSHPVLDYSPSVPGKGKLKKPSLLNSHLLSNGAVGGEEHMAQALYTWASLCKSLPGEPTQDPSVQSTDQPTILSWSSCLTDYNLLLRRNKDAVSSVYHVLEQEVSVIERVDPRTAPVLYCLAVGGAGNEKAEAVYAKMMEYTQQKDWDTCSDESEVPELKQVSCAALACLLKHTGLSSAITNPTDSPKKKLVDVYRHVFSLRHEVFTHRPIPDSEGVVSEEDRKLFQQQCSGICVTLMLLMCVLQPAFPEETDPLIPRRVKSPGVVCTTKNAGNRSPGSFLHHQSKVVGGGKHGYNRLFSFSPPEEKGKVPPLVHSTSEVPAPKHEQDISLYGVKQALSLLRWQRDRLDHLEASSGSAPEGSFHLTICSTLVSIVSQAFHDTKGKSPANEVSGLLHRVELIKALLNHQRRAQNRQKCLKKMLQFVENSDLFLPSSQVIFKGTCLKHTAHYSDDITVAPSALQHEIKSLSHKLVKLIVDKLLALNTTELLQLKEMTPSQGAVTREFMLALQWINFNHQASDLQFFFSEPLYNKVAELSCVPSTEVTVLPSLPSTKLWEGLKTACALMMQSLAMQISLNADILKTAPELLKVVSKHLFGQLQCFVATKHEDIMQKWKANKEYSLEMREVLLADFLRFLNTFSATHTSVRAVLASEQWFTTLLTLVDTDLSTGESAVSSLKTKLLALQVLGTIMSEHTDKSPRAQAKCTKIIEDLFDLMHRCMFACPMASLQGIVSDLSPLPPPTESRATTSSACHTQSTNIPFSVDPIHLKAVNCTAESDGSLLVSFDTSEPGYFIGQTPMTVGKYTWKVTVEAAESLPSFVVGVSHKPLANTNLETSDQIWAISNRGSIFHAGEADHSLTLCLAPGDTLELQYSANSADGTLLCDYGTGYMVVHGISKGGSPVYPCLLFPQDEPSESNKSQLRFHSIVHSCSMSFSDYRSQELSASGSPQLSPASTTLAQAVVSLVHQLQDKEPWNRSIGMVVGSRLTELDSLIHHLLNIEESLSSSHSIPSEDTVLTPLSLLISRLTQTVWPAMAVLGGLDSGFCLGRMCRLEGKGGGESVEAVVVSTPNSERKVVVEERVTAHTLQKVQRTVALSQLSLTLQTKFSLPLIMDHLSPSVLLNLAHLAGYLDQHSITAILERAHHLYPCPSKDMLQCLPYQLVCHSVLQIGAIKSLFAILYDQSVIRLLAYQPPPIEIVAQGACEDKSELASAVKEVLKCLSSRATKPSPLKPCLRLLELQRLHSALTSEAVTSIAEDLSNCFHVPERSSSTLVGHPSTHESQSSRPVPSGGSSTDLHTVTSGSDTGTLSSGSVQIEELSSHADAARATTPPIVFQLMDMGFTRPQVNIALIRCEVPSDTNEEARLQLLIEWIFTHPSAVEVEEEEAEHRADQQEEERLRQAQEQARQNAAANEFLSRVDEMLGPTVPTSDSTEGTREQPETKHAPDLLEGPHLEDEIPDISLSGVDNSPYFLEPLLSALGVSGRKPVPQSYRFPGEDPMGEQLFKREDSLSVEDSDSTEKSYTMTAFSDFYKISDSCDNLMNQVQKLKSVEEKMSALQRLTVGVQVLIARHVTLMLVANLSVQTSKSALSALRSLELLDVQSLVRLLRLVDAGRINNTPGSCFAIALPSSLHPLPALHCLSAAIASVVEGSSSSSAGLQLLRSCSRDLLTAAVGGADFVQQVGQGRRYPPEDKDGKSDVVVLANPNFKVSQRLVAVLAKSAGKLRSGSHMAGVVQLMDALTACLFSSKLEPKHRYWALQQLAKIFAVTGACEVMKKESVSQPSDILIAPSNTEQLAGHKGQVLSCVHCCKESRLYTIGEDNSLLQWSVQSGLEQPENSTYPLPTSPTVSEPARNALLLPTLTQSWHQNCVAGAVNESLCVWKTRDGKSVMHNFSELITTVQFKPLQDNENLPLMLVGLVDGSLALVQVLKASAHLAPELQVTDMGRCIKGAVCCVSWCPDGSQFTVASTVGHIRLFSWSDEEYSPGPELIKDLQVRSLCWSPDGAYLTVVGEHGSLQLWRVRGAGAGPALVHAFEDTVAHSVQWHSQAADDGTMLLASGVKDGKINLWLVKPPTPDNEEHSSQSSSSDFHTPGEPVKFLTSLVGHVAPITKLMFSESACLLASGCKAGSVRIWDLSTLSLLKVTTRPGSEVIDLTWSDSALAICYTNSFSLFLLPPGPKDYTGERTLRHCLPLLRHYSIAEPNKTPCLATFIKTLHHVLLEQYQYEHEEVAGSKQLVHSNYLQLLVALTVELGLHTALVSPPSSPHLVTTPTPNEWAWLTTFTGAVMLAESLSKRTALKSDVSFTLPADMKQLSQTEKFLPTANDVWTVVMDKELLEWMDQHPEDWWDSTGSSVYSWGNGTWHQLGQESSDNVAPAQAKDWKDIQAVVAGSYCTYAVKCDGSVTSCGEGSFGRLGHGDSESETSMRNISALQGISVLQLVAGPRVTNYTDEGFALVLTHSGKVYSWGKCNKGRLGHSAVENVRTPKIIDALVPHDVKQIACCDYHCAVVTETGRVLTFGSKDQGKLGHGRDVPPSTVGHVTEVARYYGANAQALVPNVKIGHVSCGQYFTLAISEDGSKVFACGEAENCAFGSRDLTGDNYLFQLLPRVSEMGPFVKAVSGNKCSALLTADGRVCRFGMIYQGEVLEAEYVQFPGDVKIVDLTMAAFCTLAVAENGDVYYWGKYQYESPATVQTTPTLLQSLSGKGIKQISAGVCHCVASTATLPLKGMSNVTVPAAVPAQFTALRDLSCEAAYARLMLLNHFSKYISKSWPLFSANKSEVSEFYVNPLSNEAVRSLVSPVTVEGIMATVVGKTMTHKSRGPSVTVQRIVTTDDDSTGVKVTSKPVFPQIASAILKKPSVEVRCPSRAWKVNLVGEGADDAGGVFDETIAQMCEELEGGLLHLLIPTPNAANNCGFNTDRYVFNPSATVTSSYKYLKFLGLLLGVAMRTRKPLDLHLAQPMWKLLAGMSLTPVDLEEVDLMFIQTLYGIRDAHKSGIKEEDFSEMIPIEFYEAQSMNGKFVPIVPGGTDIKLAFQNRKDYVEKALHFRLHELDEQVAVIREGMSCIMPVPLFCLYTAKMLEHAVCGKEQVDLAMLKKVVRYKNGASESHNVVKWLWQTLESFSNEEKILFLRFVSGRSRLPMRISDVPQRFRISIYGQGRDSLPTSQTCFFQLSLPNYPSQEVLCERLRYAIRNCRSIDMDNYMLRRGGNFIDSDEDEDYEETDDEIYDD